MQMVFRQALSIFLLPFLVVVVVPYWLLTTFPNNDSRWNLSSTLTWLSRAGGAVCLLSGFVLFCWCVVLVARVGRGPLAPWDATRNLVAIGPYRFVRNPMISGVALILFGEALLWGSWSLGMWAGFFVVFNHLYFIYSEEPGLEKRFGEKYRLYKANVPRWIPRLTPSRDE